MDVHATDVEARSPPAPADDSAVETAEQGLRRA
jgi:hypothetical protein